jgi:hypothetical protein
MQAHAGFRPLNFSRRPITVVLTSGTSWTVPPGITSLRSVECWGAGGGAAGWNLSYGGGGGGAYAKKLSLAVTPGASITYSIGAGGTSPIYGPGVDGGDTWFVNSSTVLAKGGKGSLKDDTNWLGGAGGAAGSSIGNLVYSGGKGGDTPADVSGAGGGSSATPTAAGTSGANCTTSVGGAGGSATNGGAGGAGGTRSVTAPTVGGSGVDNPKGGGGGGGGGGKTGGSGGGATGGRGGFPGGGAGSSGGNYNGAGIGSNSGAGGQIIIIYQK